MRLRVISGRFAICRLKADDTAEWARGGGFWSVTHTADELSAVCEEARVPAGVRCDRGWACLQVRGPLDLASVGVIASLGRTLADAGVSVFAISTFDTDYLLCKQESLDRAVSALRAAGHSA